MHNGLIKDKQRNMKDISKCVFDLILILKTKISVFNHVSRDDKA
jgi:hypothetical protein